MSLRVENRLRVLGRWPLRSLGWRRRLVAELYDVVLRVTVLRRRFVVTEARDGGYNVWDTVAGRVVSGTHENRREAEHIALNASAVEQEDEVPCGPARW